MTTRRPLLPPGLINITGDSMKISICMCTYNGARFIEAQLRSIYEQTLAPDEVIICDDGSSDATLSAVEAFIASHTLEDKWHLYQNPQNLGYLANFYAAAAMCTGDIVFFSDQDDIWYPGKIEKMTEVFESKPEAKVVSCKFGLLDGDGHDISGMMSPTHSNESAEIKPLTIEAVFRKCEWPAMVLAFRRKWYDEWKGMTEGSKIPHDYLFCSKAAEEHGFFQLDLELAAHRLHGDNAAREEHRLSVLLKKDRKLSEIDDYLTLLSSFEEEGVLQTPEGKEALSSKKQEMLDRKKALESGKITEVIANGRKYGRKIRLKTLICDIFIVRQKG